MSLADKSAEAVLRLIADYTEHTHEGPSSGILDSIGSYRGVVGCGTCYAQEWVRGKPSDPNTSDARSAE